MIAILRCRPLRARIAVLALALLAAPAAAAESSSEATRYTFSWPFAEDGAMAPRGGSTQGPPVELQQSPTSDFRRIQAGDISRFERDRRAILAMAGDYRVSFDFLEVMGYQAGHEPPAPYQSWATERVTVLADEGERIVLQHVLVMTFVDEDGEVQGPFVQKHWRQEWRYEAASAHVYSGANTWQQVSRDEAARAGRWLQTVWQVDDSPRYAAWGRWRHEPEYSAWTSGETWRPLPRREYSVRDDYDALVGSNRHVVLPTGWVQEQRNEKVVVDAPGEIEERVAREYGIARYERITDYDFSAGDAYWEATAGFWKLVREYWGVLLAERERIHLKSRVDQAGLFRPLFRRAQAIADGEREFDARADAVFVRETVDGYLADGPEKGAGY